MAGTFNVTVQEARGFVAVPADLDRLGVVMGCSSAGSGFSPFFLSGASAVSALGYGDAVDVLTQLIEQRQANGTSKKFPGAMYTTPGSTTGSYGTIDVTGVTGTASFSVDSTVHPFGTYEARIKWIAGTTAVGVAGATYQWSLDGGRTFSNTTALGTADSITIPNSNVKILISPGSTDETALNTLLNEVKTKLNAHVVLTTGTVHTSADNADVVSTAAATNTATRIALANALRTAYEAHRVKGSGATIHINAGGDTTNVITAPVATDDESALALALDLKTKLNAHEAGTTWHTIADATNNVTSPAPSAGSINAGDLVKVRTFAPAPSTSDVDAAFTALAAAPGDFALLFLAFPVNASMATHITTGLDELLAAGKRVTAVAMGRLPDFENAETEATWATSVENDFASFNDSRIVLRTAYGLITDAMTSRQYLRNTLAQLAADIVRVDRFVWPCAPADQPEANVSLSDSTGTLVGHDEGPRGNVTGLSNDTLGNRFSCEQRIPDPTRREAVFNTVPWTLYAADERERNLMVRRVVNAMERVAVSAAVSSLGGVLFYVPADPTVPGSQNVLTDASRNAAHGVIFGALTEQFAADIQNAADADVDAGLVQVSPIVTVSGGNLLGLSVTLAPLVLGYLLSLSLTVAVRQ